jgi:hypothetical protein
MPLSSDGRPVSEELWELLHTLSAAAMAALALACIFAGRGTQSLVFAGGWGVSCLVGLALAHAFRLALQDVMNDFHYREKFLLFIAHVAAFFAPLLLAGVRDWEHRIAAVMLFGCLHAAKAPMFSRLMAMGAAGVFWAFLAPPYPPLWMALLWLGACVVQTRLAHIRFTLAEHHESSGPSLRGQAGALARPLAAMALAAFGTHYLFSRGIGWRPLRVEWRTPNVGPAGIPGAAPSTSLLWDAVWIVLVVIAVLVLLNVIDRRLRSRRRNAEEPEALGGKAVPFQSLPPAESGLLADPSAGARARVLAGFREFARRLHTIGRGRTDGETVGRYLARMAEGADPAAVTGASEVFDRSCYSAHPIGEEEADAFLGYLDGRLAAARQAVERQRTSRTPQP